MSQSQLQVRFDDCDAGWIAMRLTAGTQILDLRLSHLLDPLPDLLSWLEAISMGLDRCGWALDEEGCFVAFDMQIARKLESFESKRGLVTLTVTPDYDALTLTCTLGRRELVQCFYLAFRDFVASDRYLPEQWECDIENDEEGWSGSPWRQMRSIWLDDWLLQDESIAQRTWVRWLEPDVAESWIRLLKSK